MPFEVCRVDKGEALPEWPDGTAGLISLGGAMHATQTKDYPFLAAEIKLMRRVVHEGGPVWGICLGAQLLAIADGGDAYRRKHPEVGWTSIEKVADDPLLRGISSPFVAFNWHEYSCKLPPTGHLIATCGDGVQVFRTGGQILGHAVPSRDRRGDGPALGARRHQGAEAPGRGVRREAPRRDR